MRPPAVLANERRRLTLLKLILAASILSTAIHFTHNFIAVKRYGGPGEAFYTTQRVAIVVAWPLLTWIGLIGYRRYREARFRKAHIALAVYSLAGLITPAHFIYADPHAPTFFYATLFTDPLAGLAVLAFVLRSVSVVGPRAQRTGA